MNLRGLFVGTLIALCVSKANAQFIVFEFKPDSTNLLFAYCLDDNNRIVPLCDVVLGTYAHFTSWQHNHSLPLPPVSTVFPTAGNTGYLGLPVFVDTTTVGQIESIRVCIPAFIPVCRDYDYLVRYGPFASLLPGRDWALIGATSSHPLNHYGWYSTIQAVMTVASRYHAEFPDYDVIAINDISLALGGIFDLRRNWRGPHYQHSRGKAADIRGNERPNSVPRVASVQARFMQICREAGATIVLHESRGTYNEHFHCEWP